MKRNVSKKKVVAKRMRPKTKLRWLLLWTALIVLLCGVIFFMCHSSSPSLLFSKYYSSMTTWISERHSHLVKKVASSKKAILNQNETPPPIHFEFYTALPNMQITGSHMVSNKETKSTPKKGVEVANANELENELSNAIKEVR